jgi:hypothetical protein
MPPPPPAPRALPLTPWRRAPCRWPPVSGAGAASARGGVWFEPPAEAREEGEAWGEAEPQCGEEPSGLSAAGAASVGGGMLIFGGADALGPQGGTARAVAMGASEMARGAPDVRAVAPEVAAAGAEVEIEGAGLCRAGLVLRVGGAACERSLAVSAERARCTLPRGAGAGLNVTAEARGMPRGGAAGAVSYPLPQVWEVAPSRGLLAGGSRLTLTGRHLGSAAALDNVTVGARACTDVQWLSASSVSCTAPPGAGEGAVRVAVLVGGQASEEGQTAPTFAYVHPVTAAAPVVTRLSPTEGPARGGTALLLNGTGLALVSGVLVGAARCEPTTVDDVAVSCVLGPALGEALPLTLVLGAPGGPTRHVPVPAAAAPLEPWAPPMTFSVFPPRLESLNSRDPRGRFPTHGVPVPPPTRRVASRRAALRRAAR